VLIDVEDLRQLLNGREEEFDVEQVRDQRASCQRARRHAAGSDGQHSGGRQGREQLHVGEVHRDEPLPAHPRLAIAPAALGETFDTMCFPPERLHGTQTRQGFLQVTVDRTNLLPCQHVRPHAVLAEEIGANDQWRQSREDDQGQQVDEPGLGVELQEGSHHRV
jgi:hypothetical protein